MVAEQLGAEAEGLKDGPKSLTVALFTTSFPITDSSVSGPFVASLAQTLASEVALEVVTPDIASAVATREYPFVVRRFRYAPIRWQRLAHSPGGIPAALASDPRNWALLPGFLLALFIQGWRAGGRVSLLHANWSVVGVIAGAAARLRGCRVLTTLRGEDVNRAKHSFAFRLLLRLCLMISTRVTVVGPSVANTVTNEVPGYDYKIRVVPNGVRSELLTLEPPAVDELRPSRLLFVGSLIALKGVATLIKALATLATNYGWELRIVGSGPEAESISTMIDQHDLADRITMVGAVENHYVTDEFNWSDVVVLPSYREGRSNVILEAMASARAVIASDIPGNSELLASDVQRGLLFPAGNAEALAERIENIFCHRSLAGELGCAGREWITSGGLTWEASTQAYVDLYREIESDRRSP